MGGVLGACLAHTGEQVTMVVRASALGQFPTAVRLESPLVGIFTAPVQKAAQVPPVDVLWIAVKATQLEPALRSVPDAARVASLLRAVLTEAAIPETANLDTVVAPLGELSPLAARFHYGVPHHRR